MRIFISLLCLLMSQKNVLAADCVILELPKVKIAWTAFKTPAKAGVSGTFKDISFDRIPQAKSILAALSDSSFNINTQTVATNDLARDKKIATFFFSTMEGGEKISGLVKSVDQKTMTATIAFTMNAKTVLVPLKYSLSKMTLKAEGILDIFDFAMADELRALNEACAAKHEGKTWNDVVISIEAPFKKCQ